jgi:antirestriction protein ArdC
MFNYVTGEQYTGKNLETLACATGSFGNDQFLTFKQAISIGRVVKKGEKGIALQRVVKIRKVNPKTGKPEDKTAIKRFTVFNITQTQPLEKTEVAA